MGKRKVLKNLFFVLIVAVLIFFIVQYYQDYKEDKKGLETHKNDQDLLDKALEEENVSYCENHSSKMKCIVIVGKNLAEESFCEQEFETNKEAVTCKASIFGDKTFCQENLQGEKLDYCNEKFENITSDFN